MSLSGVLDRDRAALVVIDLQERLAAAMAHKERVLKASGLLIDVAAVVGVPVLATRQYPRGLGDLEPYIAEALDRAESGAGGGQPARVDKVSFDCFGEPGFIDAVESAGRTQLLIAGMETHICVTQTALAAVQRGLEVHVAADACCSRDDSNHELALTRMAHAGVVVTTSESAAYELVGRAGTDEFKALLGLIKG